MAYNPRPMQDTSRIKAYHRRQIAVRVVGMAFGLAYAACWIAPAQRWVTWFDSPWAAALSLAAAMFLGYQLLSLPLDIYGGYLLEHRFDLSNETPRHFVVQQIKQTLVGAAIGGVIVAGFYACLWYAGALWWLWLWVGWIVLTVVLARVFPTIILPIFYQCEPIDRPELAERLTQMGEAAGVHVRGVYELKLSEETRKANAMLAGLGHTRRVLLSDTLLGEFRQPEIEVVFAHELAHHTRGHILKGLALGAVVSSAMVAAIVWAVGPAVDEPMAAAAAAPRALLAVLVVGIVLLPVGNAVSRHFERQADADALQTTADPDAYISAFTRLGEQNLADPAPARWIELLFYDHPPLSKRIAAAGAIEPPGDGGTGERRDGPTGY